MTETSTDVYLGTKSTSTEACKGPRGAGGPPPAPAPWMSTWEPEHERENEVRQPELEAPLTKRQLKCR